MRRGHKDHALPTLWLGIRGPMTPSGIRQTLERRGIEARDRLGVTAPSEAFLRSFVVGRRRRGDRPDAIGWLVESADARPVRRHDGRRTGEGRSPAAESGGSAVKIYCEHGRVFGVVEPHPVGGFAELRVRTPRWRDRHAAALGHPEDRDNVHWRLAELNHPTYEAEGCRHCGPRELPVRGSSRRLRGRPLQVCVARSATVATPGRKAPATGRAPAGPRRSAGAFVFVGVGAVATRPDRGVRAEEEAQI